jgi:hypothetical protein
LVFLIPYASLLAQATTKRQKIATAALNVICAIAVAGYVGTRPFWPPPAETPFAVVVALLVIMPAAFILAAIALFSRHERAYIAGTIAAVLIWPCLLQDSLASRQLGSYGLAHLAGVVAVLGLGMAAAGVLVRPVFGYWAGLLASILAWPYLILREMSYPYRGNSWSMFNCSFDSHFFQELRFAELQILSIALVTVSTVISLFRLCPNSWAVKGITIRARTWPVLTISFLLIAAWFVFSVIPYRVPTEHGGWPSEITIVHFERRGLHLRETRVSVMRDGRFYISRDAREPLRYRSDGVWFSGFVALDKWQPVVELVRSSELKIGGGSPRDVPRRWNSDTWYVYGERMHTLAYSTATRTAPPSALVDWFNDMNRMATGQASHFSTRDICLGLCYEPQS